MNPLINLVKQTVENYIKEGKIVPPPEDLPIEFLNRKAGTFVTIEKQGQLRGCIGTYLPLQKNVAEEIIHNAIAAATEDYRFGPIKEKELSSLSYTVYILSQPELVKNIKELDPKTFGIIVKTLPITYPNGSTGSPQAGTDVVFNGHMPAKSGLLLPDLEGIKTTEQQISIACQKGGIDPEREKVLIYKFSVEKYQ